MNSPWRPFFVKLLVFFTLSGGMTARAAPKEGSKAASANLQKVLWERVVAAPTFSGSQRQGALKSLHEALGKRSYSPEDEGTMILSMAVFHAWDQDVRYVVLPYIRQARMRLPALPTDPKVLSVWKALEPQFSDGSGASDLTLTAVSQILDGPILRASEAPRFHYFLGMALLGQERWADALENLSKVPVNSADYRHAKYLEGTALSAVGKLPEALDAFQVSVALDETDAEKKANHRADAVSDLREKGVLQTARILYEQGRFEESLANYRTLRQDSRLFYTSLAEQGWAFFMAGFPNRAMGAVYAASSPFFSEYYNPDIRLLDAVASYWLCDYQASRTKLVKFIAHAKDEGDSLRSLVLRFKNFGGNEALNRYARIAEDVLRGATPKNIGLGSRSLATLVRASDVQLWLGVLEASERSRLGFSKGGHYPLAKARIELALADFETVIRQSLGAAVQKRLGYMAKETDVALMRARLLHLEVLTGSKDLLVGQRRSVNGAEFSGSEKEFEDIGQDLARNWTQDKNEFWFDELGHYVFRETSKCLVPAGK
jgi:tetratricopeptide (TPR) repeat protein